MKVTMMLDIVQQIMRYVPPETCGNAMLVSRAWRDSAVHVHSEFASSYGLGMACVRRQVAVDAFRQSGM